MKKTMLSILAAVPALICAGGCTDYLYQGTIDLSYETGTYTFSHPAGFVTQEDIDRVKTAVVEADASDPVYASWLRFEQSTLAQTTHQQNPVSTLVRGDATGTGTTENYINACRDAAAAFQLGLRYLVTGDTQYADKAVEILNAWASTCTEITANDANYILCAGFQGYQFASAAELLKDYAGWNADDKAAFGQWLRDLWYPINYSFLAEHGNANVCDLHYWSNWELANMASVMAIGIFLEDNAMIDFVKRNFTEGAGSGAIGNMIPYAPVADPDGHGMIAQSMESGRDQGHATLVVSMCAELCKMAESVGLDFWGMENSKVLAMFEYTAKYNCQPEGSYITTTMPFTHYEYCIDCGCSGDFAGENEEGQEGHGAIHDAVSAEGRGTLRPCWDLIVSHYGKDRAYYSNLFAEQLRYDGGSLVGDGGAGDSRYNANVSGSYDQIGWGTLLFYQGE